MKFLQLLPDIVMYFVWSGREKLITIIMKFIQGLVPIWEQPG